MTGVSAEWRAVRALRDELGPWPASEDAATPAAMYRAALVQAMVTLARRRRTGLTMQERAALVEQYVADWQVAALLHASAAGRPLADTARRVWVALEAGGTCDELLWQWMTEAGLRPDDLVAAVAAAVAAEETA